MLCLRSGLSFTIGNHYRRNGFSLKSLSLNPHKSHIKHSTLNLLKYQSLRCLSSVKLSSKSTDNIAENPKSTGLGAKAKELWNSYGYVALGTYFSLYVCTLGSFFICLDQDLLNAAAFGLDPVVAIKKVCGIVENLTGYTTLPEYVKDHPQVGTLAIAWFMTKLTEPVRIALSLLVVPKIAKLFGMSAKMPPITSK